MGEVAVRLASVAGLRAAMGFDNIDDVTRAIEDALDAATDSFEAVLRTAFLRSSRVDVFLPGETYVLHGMPRLQLRLTHGFVVAASVKVYYADSIPNVVSVSDRVDATTSFFVDAEAGVLSCFDLDLDYKVIRVEYTAGFDLDDVVADQFALSEVPSWLQQAARLSARIRLNNHPYFKSDKEDASPRSLESDLSDILSAHVRYFPAACQPAIRG